MIILDEPSIHTLLRRADLAVRDSRETLAQWRRVLAESRELRAERGRMRYMPDGAGVYARRRRGARIAIGLA
jgi:hypothetical protein